ncbi:MAG: S-layer homology domain-containing protein [Lachnospiraceae bacterium]|nr:MAG: S-layer homology domain-containing protein [Lachnospiraceae bacterium]
MNKMKWKWKRLAAFLLAAAMIFTMPGVPASAVEAGASAVHTGLCEHHPKHTEDCGYTEGTEGAACEHEHTEDCYTLVEKCIHKHDESCYPVLEGSVSENTATPSEAEEAQPTACTHKCSEESGCITKELSCPHERGEHDESCGYIPATEGTPCGYTCEQCQPKDSGPVLGTSRRESEIGTSVLPQADHTHCVCGGNGDVNGHEHDTAGTEWTEWTKTDALPDSASNYYLTQSVSGSWTVPKGKVNLCLNGQTISGSITVGSGASLTLTDCSDSGRVQGGVLVNGGKFELYSGTITGGVQVGKKSADYKTGSSFTMYGGAITGNEDYGGVFLVGTTNHTNPPSFTMHGGTISDNTAGASDGGGGGVYVGEKCSFTMDGGTITGNTATNGNGGGIYIHMLANVTISGGEITNNKAPATGDISHGHGGGIYSESGVTVKNVTITGNNSNFEGGGIYGKGTINLTDATVTDNNRYDVYYGGVENSYHKLTVSGSVKAGYYANNDWKLPIFVSGLLSADSVIRVGVYDGIKPAYGSQLAIAEPASGVTLSAENFKADAADCVTSLGSDGKVYLARCAHVMDSTGYTCEKCKTQFDARVGESAYYQTLAETFLKAWNGSTITLLRDVTLTGNCSASNTILDLNGKTITSGDKFFNVNEKLTVKDSSEGGGRQALNVKFSVGSNGTLVVDNSYTGEISRVELQAGGALEAYTGTIQELLLGKGNGTGYSVKLWKGNAHCCTVKKITLAKDADQALTVGGLLKTNHAKCELYGEKGGAWSIVPKTKKISELTGYTAYKVQFQECVHQCADDTAEKPVCSKCGKALVVKITATASDGKTKTAWFPVDSAIENGDGYVEAIQTLNGWSAEGYTDATLMPLCDAHDGKGGIGIKSVTLTGKLAVDGGKHRIHSTTIASGADVTFKTGQFYHTTVNGKASFVGGTYLGSVTASSGAEAVFSGGAYQYLYVKDGGTAVVKNSAEFGEDVEVTKGTLTVEGGSFKAAVVVEGDGTMNVNGGSFTGTGIDKVKYDNGAKGTVSGGSFAELYLYGSGTAWLAGGSFTKLSTASSDVLSSLLADGAAYYDQSGNAISNSGVSELNNVTVKTHTHTVDEQTGICSVCQKQMAASLTAGNETSWYLTLDAAIEAANEGNGEKTLKLYQDVRTNVPSYELTHGPVALDVNGKTASGMIITVKDIQLTVTGTGTIWGVTASGSSAVVKNSTVKINYITAENGGRLELGGGSYMGLTVKNDGSSASLSGGTYKKIEWGKFYVPANEYLADGYGYKTSDGTWEDGTASVDNVTVTPAPIKSTKVYPNSETDYSGSTFDAKDSTSVTLTVSVTSDESAGLTYTWYRFINDTWRSLTNSFITQGLTEKYTGADSQTLSITELPAGQTFSYKVQIVTGDGYKCFSEPFTVTRHQHSWTYTASGATITAKCTENGCYLADKLGGTFTISAPAANTLTYDGNAKEATAKLDALSGVTSLPTVGSITYAQNGAALSSAPVNAGEYTASITVGNATASVKYTIQRADPKASDFTFTVPAGLTYDGNAKTAAVEPNTGINGMGAVTVKYFKNGAETEPKVAGDYTVKVSVAEGANYNATTDDLTTDVWKFTIGKATQTITVPTDKTIVKGGIAEDISDWATVAGVSGGSNPGTPSYALNDQAPEGVSLTGNQLTVQPTCTAAQFTIKVTAAETDNYNAAEETFTVTVVDKATADVTITGLPGTVSYGQKFILAASQTDDTTSANKKWTWDYDQEYFKLVGPNANTETITLQAIKAGTPSKGITATYESGTHKGSATVNAVVEKKEVTVTAGSYKVSKTYDGTTNAGTATGELNVTGILSADSGVTVKVTPVAYTSANVGGQTSMNVSIALDGTGKDNYKIKNGATTVSVPCEVTKAMLTVEGTGTASGTYGDKLSGLTVSGLTARRNGTVVPGTWSLTGNTVPNVGDNGTYTATFTPESGVDNYDALTKDGVTLNITKAAYGNQSVSGSAKYGTTGSVDLSRYLAAGGSFGTITTADSEKVLSGDPVMEGNSLKFTFVNDASKANKMATITVPVTGATNYESYTIIVTVTVNDKTTPVVTAPTAKTRLVYNGADQVLIDAGSATGGTLQYSLASGSGYSTELPKVKNAGTYTVYYKVIGNDGYADVPENSVSVSVAKRAISVKADNKSMTANGTLPTFTVTYGNFASGDSEATVIETKATAFCTADGTSTGSFPITVSGTTALKSGMDTNYEVGTPESGTLTVNPRSSGGGGGSSSSGGGSSSGGSGGSGGSSSGDSDDSDNNDNTNQPEDKPQAPVTGETKPIQPDKNGNAAVDNSSVQSAIDKAKQDAKKNGTTENGIAVTVPITSAAGQTSFNVTIKAQTLDLMVKENVRQFTVATDHLVSVNIGLDTLKQLDTASAGGDIILRADKVDALRSTEAKAAIGTRPAYDLSLVYLSSGKETPIANLNGHTISVRLPYTPAKGEQIGNLYAVYVDDAGKVEWITKSSYDASQKAVVFETGHFSIYGIGYKNPAPAFTDITGHWAADNILFVASRGLLSGTSDTTFSPNTGMTRGMFVTALGRLAGINPDSYKTGKFTDVKADAYYAPYVNWAAQTGIVEGVTAITFAPDTNINREQMAVIMANYAKKLGCDLPKTLQAVTFADNAQISSWAKDAVKAMQQAGILAGKANNRFDPKGTATRAEVATVLRRFVEIVIDSQTANGWQQNDSGQWSYYRNGKPVKGWLSDDQKWYWLVKATGMMFAGGWKQIDGKWYYFYPDGTMAVNTTIDGYTIGPDGARK